MPRENVLRPGSEMLGLPLPLRRHLSDSGLTEEAALSDRKPGHSSRPATPTGGRIEAPATNVRVVCRVRPMSERERKAGTIPAATASTERREVAVVRQLAGGTRQLRSTFHFDDVLTSFGTQEDVFKATLQPLVSQVLAGFETTAFAYGQTGTGKTYTMEGDLDSEEGRGLVPRTAKAIIDALSSGDYIDSAVTVSYLEIYNEELSDLLATGQQKLDIKDVGQGRGVCCFGLSEVAVASTEDILALVRKAQDGRRMAETRVNARSSRSHSIFTMKVRCRKKVAVGELENFGKLHLVDLAGSECAKKGGSVHEPGSVAFPVWSSTEEERERRNINQSLLTLGRVITALRDGSGRVPYRDSKLTRLLQDALGGHCRTVIIATISPALSVVEETISTLSYAEQASGIRNRPVASSLLRTNRAAGSETRPAGGESGSSSGCGASDWAELEMKVAYLTQEVEETQGQLARKYLEAQENLERAECAEDRTAASQRALAETRLALDQHLFVHERLADFAAERGEDTRRLDDALQASEEHSRTLAEEIARRDRQREGSKAQAQSLCARVEEQALVHESSLAAHSSAAKHSVTELKRGQEAACALGQRLQSEQCSILSALSATVTSSHHSSGAALAELAIGAQEALTSEAAHAVQALSAIEVAAAAAAEAATTGSSMLAVAEAERIMSLRSAALREDLSLRRQALAEATRRTSSALAAAAAAVAELSGLAESSLSCAEDAMASLEAAQQEVTAACRKDVSSLVAAVQKSSAAAAAAAADSRSAAAEACQRAVAAWGAAETQQQLDASTLQKATEEALAASQAAATSGAALLEENEQVGTLAHEQSCEALAAVSSCAMEALMELRQVRGVLSERPLEAFATGVETLPTAPVRPSLQIKQVPTFAQLAAEFEAKENCQFLQPLCSAVRSKSRTKGKAQRRAVALQELSAGN